MEEVAAEFHKLFLSPLGYVKKVFAPAPTAKLVAPYTVKVHPDGRQMVSVQYFNRSKLMKPNLERYKAGAYDFHFTGLFCASRGGARRRAEEADPVGLAGLAENPVAACIYTLTGTCP